MNKRISEVLKRLIRDINIDYGFCGVAQGDDFMMINTADNINKLDIVINIKTTDWGNFEESK